MTLKPVDLELAGHPDLGPVDKREGLVAGMYARLLFHGRIVKGAPVEHRLWFRLTNSIHYAGGLGGSEYRGVLVSETHLDVDRGHELMFGPEHVLEWTTRL